MKVVVKDDDHNISALLSVISNRSPKNTQINQKRACSSTVH